MDELNSISLLECPICGGPGVLEYEYNWCAYVSCGDCGCHTAEIEFRTPEERLAAARAVADAWNYGKVVTSAPGD